jgi:hypothetical protein
MDCNLYSDRAREVASLSRAIRSRDVSVMVGNNTCNVAICKCLSIHVVHVPILRRSSSYCEG